MIHISKKELDKLPVIQLDVFEAKVQKLAEELWLLKKLFDEGATWKTLPDHLRNDLFMRIGAKPYVNKY